MRRTGFTLIELAAVLLILGIAAAAVTARMAGMGRAARAEEVLAEAGRFDHLTRVSAVQHDRPMRLEVDLNAGRIVRLDADEGRELGSPLELPRGWHFLALHVSGQDETDRGRSLIPVSRLGLTHSYALGVAGPHGQKRWLVAAGLSGRIVTVDDEEQMRRILYELSERTDAR